MGAVTLPTKCAFLFQPSRYKVLWGGRGGGKSHSIAKALLVQGMQTRHRILCTREFQVSIRESVHKLLSGQIDLLGLRDYYHVQKAQILGKNGTEFIFAGIKTNTSNIKSMEGLTRVWVEEAEKVSEESWQVLIPTVRAAGSEIWISFNPHEETDPTYRRFVAKPPPGATVVRLGWEDNPWFPPDLRAEKDYLYSIDPEAADHVWGGATRKNAVAAVLRGRWVMREFEPQKHWAGPYYGADWGFANDPTALIRMWVDPGKVEKDVKGKVVKVLAPSILYVEHEAYEVGCEIDNTPTLFDKVPEARKYTIRADSARPETISFMKHHGFPNVVAAKKGQGSVEDGVEHLRSYSQIVIHPRCPHAAEEAKLWSFKTDKLTGEILPVLIDKHNHLICDSARYGLEPLIRFRESALERLRKLTD